MKPGRVSSTEVESLFRSLRSGLGALDAVDHEVDDTRDHGGEEDQHEGRGSYRQEDCHATEEVIKDLWGLREDGAQLVRVRVRARARGLREGWFRS